MNEYDKEQIEDLKEQLTEGRIDQVMFDRESADIEGVEADDFDEEEQEAEEDQELEEKPPVEKKPPKDDTGEQTSAREALMRRYPNSPELW